MDKDDFQIDPDRPIRIAKTAIKIAEFLDNRQKFHARKAQEYGYSKETWKSIGETMFSANDDPLYSGIERSVNNFSTFLDAREKETQKVSFDVSSASYTLGTSVSSTASTVALVTNPNSNILNKIKLPAPPNFLDFYQIYRICR